MDTTNWIHAGAKQILSGPDSLGVAVTTSRQLTKEEGYIVSDAIDNIIDEIFRLRVSRDPEMQNKRVLVLANLRQCLLDNKVVTAPKEVPNTYCSRYCCWHKPWLSFEETPIGPLTIGWRKRVIQITWTDVILKKTPMEILPEETVTKEHGLIHAYSYEDATKYLGRLFSAV